MSSLLRTFKGSACILPIFLIFAVLNADRASAWGGNKSKRKQKKADKILSENYTPGSAWEAYFKDDEGRTKKLIQPVEQNSDKDWMGLTFTDYKGPTLRLAVMPVENKSAGASQLEEGTSGAERLIALLAPRKVLEVPLGAIEELMMTALFNTNRFEVIERKALGAVLAEQDFGASDRVAAETRARTGRIRGVDYQIFATINEWTPKKSKVGATGGGRLGGRLGLSGGKSKAEVAMSFRVVDSDTGQMLFSTTQKSTAGSWGVGLGGFGKKLGLGVGIQQNSPINYAVMSCVNKGIFELSMWLNGRRWRGSVMKVDGDRVFINAGSNKGIEMRQRMTCLSKGEELIDPETGDVLGADLVAIGSVMVTSVQEKISVATVMQGCSGLKFGDYVELESGDGSETAMASAGQ